MSIAADTNTNQLRARLHKFMERPQRHRLLHGYPLAAAMPYADRSVRAAAANGALEFALPLNRDNDLLVGVLPHPFCNPKIRGCGYCTFPHESFSSLKSSAVVRAVIRELDQRLVDRPEIQGAPVAGLYFGGGTANLTPEQPFRLLTRKLFEVFDLTHAEVSLEGVPARFVEGEPLLIDVMQEELPARHFRISMGIQSFSEERLAQMGRLAFGRPATFAAAVKAAHQRGMTTSGDLLFNLPAQSLLEMQDDVKRAVNMGLDQICLYHLVMFRGLGSVWSRDPSLLAALPDNEQAADNWLVLRQLLLNNGFRQTSLTNFERRELANDSRRYCYETISFQSDHCNVLGFGPAGISYLASSDGQTALKTMNPESSDEYIQAVHQEGSTWNRYFQYRTRDSEVLHLTRRLAALHVDKVAFTRRFGQSGWSRYEQLFDLLVAKRLVDESGQAYSLTPRGMFFSDSIAALLAESRRRDEREMPFLDSRNDNASGYM